MRLLVPQRAFHDWWESYLYATGGSYRFAVVLYADGSAEVGIEYALMGTGHHRIQLHGRHEARSDAYGWIHIARMLKSVDQTLTDFHELDLTPFEGSIALEYVRTKRSPFDEHPRDMLNMAARWPEHFDMILLTMGFTEELVDGFQYMLDHPAEYESVPDRTLIENVTHTLGLLDKRKFETVSAPSGIESGGP